MKKFKRYLFAAVAAMMLFLTGCGTELHEMTAEEEQLIIHSAAYFVAKHNIQQKDGVNGYPLPDSFEEESESESESESETSGTENGSGEGAGETKPADDMLVLAELIGHKGDIKITYEGSQVTKSYTEGSAYVVEAESGKTFFVLNFKLTNTTDKDVEVNNVAKSPSIKLTSDAGTVKAEVTFLSNDFTTYLGTLKEGESVETILLFEVSETAVEKITAPKLQITIEKNTKTIKL